MRSNARSSELSNVKQVSQPKKFSQPLHPESGRGFGLEMMRHCIHYNVRFHTGTRPAAAPVTTPPGLLLSCTYLPGWPGLPPERLAEHCDSILNKTITRMEDLLWKWQEHSRRNSHEHAKCDPNSEDFEARVSFTSQFQ